MKAQEGWSTSPVSQVGEGRAFCTTTAKRARFLSAVLASALLFAACDTRQPVTILTGSAECYDGWTGDLAFDAASNGVSFDIGAGPNPIQWPLGYTGRRSGREVEILNRAGTALYRTGTRVSLMGDGWQSDKMFRVCGLELIP
jgi:hypothetical protein